MFDEIYIDPLIKPTLKFLLLFVIAQIVVCKADEITYFDLYSGKYKFKK